MNKQKHYYKHGMTGTKFYGKWNHMQSRCYNKNNKDYKHYGGRDIICEWNNFLEFKNDMYESYLKHIKKNGEKNTEIDRIDNDGNYSKENCRFLTRQKNTWNTRRNKIITIDGITKSFPEWCYYYKINSKIVRARMNRGWSLKKSLKTALNTTRDDQIKYIFYKKKKRKLSDLAGELGISYQALSYRLKKMSIEKAMNIKKDINHGMFVSEKFTYKDKKYTLKELSEMTGIKSGTISNRIKRLKWSVDKAVEKQL